MKKARCIDVLTSEGTVILRLYLHEHEVELRENSSKQKTGKELSNDSPNEEALMTPAQKRYLFRILADQKLEGDKAHEKLKTLFQVDSLKEVSKLEASRMIEALLENNKGGGKNDRSPF